MKNSNIIIVGLLVAAVLGPWLVYRSSQSSLQQAEEELRRNKEQLAQLSTENQRLTGLLETSKSQSHSDEQMRELMKLRNEVSQLRRKEAEMAKLQEANTKLAAGNSQTAGTVSASANPSSAAPAKLTDEEMDAKVRAIREDPNYWAKDRLTYSGYSDPSSALKSALWAMQSGDMKSVLEMQMPQNRTNSLKAMEGKSEDEIAAMGKRIASSLGPAGGFLIMDQQPISDDEVAVDVLFEGEGPKPGKVRKIIFKRFDQEWKVKKLNF